MKNYKAEIAKKIYESEKWGSIYSWEQLTEKTHDKYFCFVNAIFPLIREIVQEATDGMDECGKEILSNIEEMIK